MISTAIRLPDGMNPTQVFALESVFRDLARGINERGYLNIPMQDAPSSHDLTMLSRSNRVTAGYTLLANVFSPLGVEGHIFYMFNDSAASVTATQGTSLTLRLGGTTTTGNRTHLAYGLMWVWYPSTTVAIVGGHVT